MIITRTPFRITLGGGGTDLPSYYSKYGGFIFSAGIDKYMYISVSRPFEDELIRLRYTESEQVENLDEVKHNIARETLRYVGIEKKIQISSIADIPSGTGLGSSSCYTVGVLQGLHTLKRENISLERLAEEDFHIEAEVLNRPIGKQDPYLAAFGGLTVLTISTDGRVAVRKANVSESTAQTLNDNMLVFYTGIRRNADPLLSEQQSSITQEKKEVVESMHVIKDIGQRILRAMEENQVDTVGKLFDEHWQYKKKISSGVTRPDFDLIYLAAKEAGALGGKISGAGGGGFFTFYVPEKHEQFRKVMKTFGLREMPYRFDFEGSKVLVDL